MYHASKSGQILVGHIYIYTGSFSDAYKELKVSRKLETVVPNRARYLFTVIGRIILLSVYML
jgi:hypothetical protein